MFGLVSKVFTKFIGALPDQATIDAEITRIGKLGG